MSITTALYIALAAFFALGFVFFKYLYKVKKRTRVVYALSFFRFFSIFTLLLLLIDPQIVQNHFETVKPKLNVLIDRSLSISELGESEKVRAFYNRILEDEEISERFDLRTYSLGSQLNILNKDSLKFEENKTNINQALVDLQKTNNKANSAVVLISDGNQTIGEDYSYFKADPNTSIFSIVAGDTTSSPDVYISNLNANKYAFLNNKFPIELILNYTGEKPVSTNLKISSGDQILKTQKVNFTKENSSQVITLNLEAKSIGTHMYKATMEAIEQEKNVLNNSQNFAIEVIDERTSVLIISSIIHPDLGMLKKSIESNEQREVEIVLIDNINKIQLSDFQLIILYQPNNKFKPVFSEIQNNNYNNLLISGVSTDWNFLNSEGLIFSKSYNLQAQDYLPIYNNGYSQFQFDDIYFDSFPPLVDKFGNINFKNNDYQILLNKSVEGIKVQEPLLFTYSNNTQKNGVLLGENIWKWRAQSYVKTGSFENFDGFLGKLIQYLSSTKQRNRLDLSLEPFYKENEEILFSAQYFDKNYLFDPKGELNLNIENEESGKIVESTMLLNTNDYIFKISDLEPGSYKVRLKEQSSGLVLNKEFSILEYNVEQQFTKADISRMKQLSEANNGKTYLIDDFNSLKHQLLKEKRFISVQKNHEKAVSFINWKILLALLILSLSCEWFTRKYFGLI